jgi:hypothetical protein
LCLIDQLPFPANAAACRNSPLLAPLSLGLEVLTVFGRRQPINVVITKKISSALFHQAPVIFKPALLSTSLWVGLSSNSLVHEGRDAYIDVDGKALKRINTALIKN